MSDPAIEIIIDALAWETIEDLECLGSRAVEACCNASGAGLAKGSEVAITFCDDDTIRALNAQWRKRDAATNVLSFPMPGRLEEKLLLGDIVIAHETVAREAAEQGKTFEDHTTHMIIHGFLHLIGYDHETPEEAGVMESLERRIAATLGLSDPYEREPGELSGSDVVEE
ncbi:MAG: rRNA maturation RNase YbeY [Methylocystis sp.]